jgi:hypothetical protein
MLLGVTIFIMFALTYLGMEFGYKPYLASRIQKLTQQVAELDQEISSADQENLLLFHSQLATLEYLLKNHPRPSGLLSAIESKTLPAVFYQSIQVKTEEQKVVLAGTALDVLEVAQEARRLSTIPGVKGLFIQSARRERSYVIFSIQLTLDPNALKFSSQ